MSDDARQTLKTGGEHDVAIDAAVELLGAALRVEHETAGRRRADVLRVRLENANRAGALRERVAPVRD